MKVDYLEVYRINTFKILSTNSNDGVIIAQKKELHIFSDLDDLSKYHCVASPRAFGYNR
jgi:hypothetical protein